MWVVVYHAQGWPQLPQMNEVVRVFFSWGFIGVDIFFVISGCVMALTLRRGDSGVNGALNFSVSRLARIYVGWWPIFFLYWAWLGYVGQLGPDKDLFNSFFLLLAPPQNLVTAVLWTLTFELYFYVLMGALKVVSDVQRERIVKVLFLGVALYVAYMASRQRFEPENIMRSTAAMHFWASPLLLEFFGGFLVFEQIGKRPGQSWRPWLAAAVILFLVSAIYHQFLVRHPGGLEVFYHYPERVLLVGGACCALLGFMLLMPTQTDGRWVGVSSLLGGASYAIYLLHPLIFSFSSFFFVKLNPGSLYKPLMYMGMLIGLIGFAILYHQFLEKPIYSSVRKLIDRFSSRRRLH
jgi:peptidoglycan/LPS O-acetylase OafA/YrhL